MIYNFERHLLELTFYFSITILKKKTFVVTREPYLRTIIFMVVIRMLPTKKSSWLFINVRQSFDGIIKMYSLENMTTSMKNKFIFLRQGYSGTEKGGFPNCFLLRSVLVRSLIRKIFFVIPLDKIL